MAPPDQTKFHIFSQTILLWLLLAGVVGTAAAASIPLKQKFPH